MCLLGPVSVFSVPCIPYNVSLVVTYNNNTTKEVLSLLWRIVSFLPCLLACLLGDQRGRERGRGIGLIIIYCVNGDRQLPYITAHPFFGSKRYVRVLRSIAAIGSKGRGTPEILLSIQMQQSNIYLKLWRYISIGAERKVAAAGGGRENSRFHYYYCYAKIWFTLRTYTYYRYRRSKSSHFYALCCSSSLLYLKKATSPFTTTSKLV